MRIVNLLPQLKTLDGARLHFTIFQRGVELVMPSIYTYLVLIGHKQNDFFCSTTLGELSCTNTKARKGQGVSYSSRNQDTA